MTKRKKRLHYTGENPRLVKEDRKEDQRIVKKIREEVKSEADERKRTITKKAQRKMERIYCRKKNWKRYKKEGKRA